MIGVLAFAGLLLLALAAFTAIAERAMDFKLEQPPRADHRIPASERRLLGPDFTVHTDRYFAKRRARDHIIAREMER